MFDMFSDGPRTWKWAVPGFFCVLLLWGTYMLFKRNVDDFGALLGLLFLLCFWVARINYWKLSSEHRERLFSEHQIALSTTPLVLLSNNMKQMHPEAIRVLERFGVRTSWQVRVDVKRNMRTWVLEGTNPNVHFGFIEFVLSKSGRALYPKNRLSDGSKKWDPDGVVTDREQHEEFEKWLFSRLMVTRSHGDFKPAEFIPPWTPQLILETMGLTGEQDLYQPEEDKTVKQLPAEKETVSRPRAEEVVKRDVRDLTLEEQAAIEAENARYASMYADGKIPA